MRILLLCCVVGIALLFAFGVSVLEKEKPIWNCTAEVNGQTIKDGSMVETSYRIWQGRSTRNKAEKAVRDEICDAIREFSRYDGEPCEEVPIECALTEPDSTNF